MSFQLDGKTRIACDSGGWFGQERHRHLGQSTFVRVVPKQTVRRVENQTVLQAEDDRCDCETACFPAIRVRNLIAGLKQPIDEGIDDLFRLLIRRFCLPGLASQVAGSTGLAVPGAIPWSFVRNGES